MERSEEKRLKTATKRNRSICVTRGEHFLRGGFVVYLIRGAHSHVPCFTRTAFEGGV
jgi:hypothetical protein